MEMDIIMDVGLLVLIFLGICLSIYLIFFIRKAKKCVTEVETLLKANREGLDKTLKNLPVITQSIVEITDTAKEEMKAVGSVIGGINEAVQATAAAAQTVRNDILTRIRSILDILELIKWIFSKKSKSGGGDGTKSA